METPLVALKVKPGTFDWIVFAFSIVSLLTCWPTGWISLLLASIAICIYPKRPVAGRRLSIAALITIVISFLFMIFLIFEVLVPTYNFAKEIQEQYMRAIKMNQQLGHAEQQLHETQH